MPDSFTSYSRTDTNRLEYCEWLNSDGEDGGRNNAGGRGEIDDDGGDGGRGQELDVEVKKKMESPSPMTSLSSFLVPCSWAYGEVSRGILYSLLESLLSNLVLSRDFPYHCVLYLLSASLSFCLPGPHQNKQCGIRCDS